MYGLYSIDDLSTAGVKYKNPSFGFCRISLRISKGSRTSSSSISSSFGAVTCFPCILTRPLYFGDPSLGGAGVLWLLAWAAASICSCFCLRSSGSLGNGEVVRIGSTESFRRVFWAGSAVRGGDGLFFFRTEVGRFRCLSWYFARFGFQYKVVRLFLSICSFRHIKKKIQERNVLGQVRYRNEDPGKL